MRDVTFDDLRRILALEPELFGAEAWSESTYRSELSHPDRRFRAIDADGCLVAWAGVLVGESAEILTVGVAPDHRRRGHASALMRDLLSLAADAGARECFLEVRAGDDGAQALYRSLGFAPIGVRRRYYRISGEDAVVMRATLGADTAR